MFIRIPKSIKPKPKGLPINKMSNRRLSLQGSTASRCISTLKNGAGLSPYELSAGCYEFSHKSLPHFNARLRRIRKVPYRFYIRGAIPTVRYAKCRALTKYIWYGWTFYFLDLSKKIEPKIYDWFLAVIGLLIIDIAVFPSLTGFAILGLISIGSVTVICRDKSFFIFDIINRFAYKRIIANIAYIMGGTLCVLDALSTPANALFLKGAEDFMKKSFKDVDDAIALTFNVLRGLVLIYLAIALIDVVGKMQRNEDWQTAARTPLIVLMVVVIGDVISDLIIT